MRVEIVPRVRIRNTGTIEVVIWKFYYDTPEDKICPICGWIKCPNIPKASTTERLHHKEAYVARDGYWITVEKGESIPDKCKLIVGELVTELHDYPEHWRELPGSSVYRSLAGLMREELHAFDAEDSGGSIIQEMAHVMSQFREMAYLYPHDAVKLVMEDNGKTLVAFIDLLRPERSTISKVSVSSAVEEPIGINLNDLSKEIKLLEKKFGVSVNCISNS